MSEAWRGAPNFVTVISDFVKRALTGDLHLPPWWLRDVGGSDFEATGREFLGHFVDLAGLRPDARVLEIGCGSGRMALPLSGFLNRNGAYTGIDITAPSIAWCQQHIARRHPNFQFRHADLYNKRYNPTGRVPARAYAFPFPDGSFDLVFLTSVFTHLLPEDTEHYVREIARMLAPAGRALLTFFLLNTTQQQLAGQGRSDIGFGYAHDQYSTRSDSVPESAVAYSESYVFGLLAACALEFHGPVRYGTWSGRADGLSYQDIIVVRHSPREAGA